MSLVSPTIDIEAIIPPTKGMISSCLRGLIGYDLNPFVLQSLVLKEIREVLSFLPSVPSENEDALKIPYALSS